MNYLKKFLLLTLFCILTSTSVCYGDMIVRTPINFISRYKIFTVIAVGMAVILLISLLCMLTGKCIKSENLISKTKKVAENIWYYLLVVFAIFIVYVGKNEIKVVAVVALAVSMFLRIKSKKKKGAYIVIAILLLSIYSLEIICIVNNEPSQYFNRDWLRAYEKTPSVPLIYKIPELNQEDKAILNANEVKTYKFVDGIKSGPLCTLNLDGYMYGEIISLSEIIKDEEKGIEYVELSVNDCSVRFTAENIVQEVVAFSMGDNYIFLGLHADGPSEDPYSEIYLYKDDTLEKVGELNCDISLARKFDILVEKEAVLIDNSTIKCKANEGTLLNYVYKIYDWKDRKFVERDMDEYDYVDTDLELKLKKDIVVYESCDKDSKYKKIKKQTVYAIKKGKGNWNYIKSKDGIEGWFEFEPEEYDDIFSNSYMAG